MEGDQGVINQGRGDDDLLDLPPGFRFHPTDEEIITHYLVKKVVDRRFSASAMGEADLNECEPWDLPKRAKMGEKEWYFFVQKDRKYPTGKRTNRATESGYWKATGKDKAIFRGKRSLVGMKKTLVFYKGRAPKGEKTNWVMHEFRLDGKLAYYHLSKPSKDEWVVCKVFHKSTGIRSDPIISAADVLRNDSAGDFLGDSIPPLVEPANYYSGQSSSFTHGEEDHDRDNGIKNHFRIPSGTTMIDPNCGGNFTGPQFSEYEYPSSLFSSYMHGPHNSDYFVGYRGADNHRRTIIRGPAAEKSLKPEQFSSIVSPSQDTVVSTDANVEITSCAVSGYQYQASGHYAHDDPERQSVDPISDILEYSWREVMQAMISPSFWDDDEDLILLLREKKRREGYVRHLKDELIRDFAFVFLTVNQSERLSNKMISDLSKSFGSSKIISRKQNP